MKEPFVGWFVFVVASYVLGHLLFTLGSFLDYPCDWIREALQSRKDLSLLKAATRVRDHYLRGEPERQAINTYKWSLASLTANHPSPAHESSLIMADSKLFRSMCATAIGSALVFAFQENWPIVGTIAVTILALFYRYYELRKKAIQQTYIYTVSLHSARCLIRGEAIAGGADIDAKN